MNLFVSSVFAWAGRQKEKLMQITNDILARYAGGELEIQNSNEHYLYRGEVERAWIDGDNMKVRFKWMAKMGEDYKWHTDANLDYAVSLLITSFNDLSDGRIVYSVMYVYERGAFFPPNGSKLDPAKVEGLELEPA